MNDAMDATGAWICYWCGRRGQRGYMTLTGKVTQPPESVVCVNRKACERRQRAAERREAARGNWS